MEPCVTVMPNSECEADVCQVCWHLMCVLEMGLRPTATWGVPDPSAPASYQLHSPVNGHISLLPTAGPRTKSDDYQHMEQVKSEELMDVDVQNCDLPTPGSAHPKAALQWFSFSFHYTLGQKSTEDNTAQQNPLHGKGHPKQRSLLTSKFSPHYSQSTAWRQSLDKGKVPEFLRAHKHFATAFYLQGTQLLCWGTTSHSWSCHPSASDMVWESHFLTRLALIGQAAPPRGAKTELLQQTQS